jgi:hypothetical protein
MLHLKLFTVILSVMMDSNKKKRTGKGREGKKRTGKGREGKDDQHSAIARQGIVHCTL